MKHTFSAEYLERLSELIAERTGLNTFEHEHGRHRLVEILQKHSEIIYDPFGYLNRLYILAENHPIWQALLAQLTIGETYFMRDETQIAALKNHLLPQLIDNKRRQQQPTLRIWSAGCASGEEAYTVAMLLYDLLPDRQHWHLDIFGTDINQAAIEVATAAIYREWSFRTTPSTIRERFFIPLDAHNGLTTFIVRPEIRAMVRFSHANLISQRYFQYPFDLVLCRNVLIYFTSQQIAQLEYNLHEALHEHGWLMLSPAETLRHTRHHFEIHHLAGTLTYQKKTPTTAAISMTSNPPLKASISQALSTSITPSISPIEVVEAAMDIYQQVQEILQQANSEEAIQYISDTFTKAARSTHPALYTLLASIYASEGNYVAATEQVVKALAIDPLYADAHYLMGLIQIELQGFEAARTSIRAAIYCRPDFALAHLLSGDLFEQQNDHSRALKAWATARRFARNLSAEAPLSPLSDITAAQLIDLVNSRLQLRENLD